MADVRHRPVIPGHFTSPWHMADTPAPRSRHTCHCGKSFIRKEHLRRHQASHTGRSFRCDVCGRSFTRSDLLRRHATLHDAATVSHEPRRDRACDACHANKTRCSGGLQCTLCAKRGVVCTYKRGLTDGESSQAGLARSRDGSVASSQTSPTAMPAPAPGPAVGAVAAITATQAAAGTSTVTAPLVLQTNETQEAEELVRFSRAAALNILYGILTQSPVVSPSEPQAIPRAWLSRCVNSYLATFHGRWPILHGPTLNEVTDSVPTIALIVAIDSWLQGEAKLKDQILQIHGLLVERFYRELSQCKWDPLQPWPVDLYQLCLVNIAFAFETGRDSIIRQSQMLFSLLVSCLRMHGCFHGDAVEAQRVTHFPGEFRPWIFATVERWKRIATCAFKVDACLSLLYGQPPLLRRAELDLGLTSTYAMWNSHGIMVFFDRSRSEPWTRGSYSMSQLDVRKPEEVPSGILPEDIQLCLLGMCNEVWSAKREAVLNPDLTGLKRADLAHKLYIAQEQLDTIVAESRKPLVVGGYTATIIKSYLGGEPARGANWRQEVTNRLDSCVTNIRPLLLLLTIHLHADVSKMRDVYLMPAPLQMEPAAASRTWQQNVLAIQEWALSPDGRTAVVAALQTWFAYESSLLMNASHTFDPIMFLALSAAVMVLWAWSMNEDVCVCDPTIPKIDITGVGMHLQPEVQNWIRSGTNGGGGAISYLGQPVCRCHAASRVAEWTDALARAGQTWETADVDARLFRSTLLA